VAQFLGGKKSLIQIYVFTFESTFQSRPRIFHPLNRECIKARLVCPQLSQLRIQILKTGLDQETL